MNANRMVVLVRTAAWALVAAVVVGADAHAQGTARSLDIGTSIRAAGMGGASAGVVWGDADVWGNVASLSRVTGVRWEQGHTQLLPGLASDITFDSRRVLVGRDGIGVGLLGVPVVLSGVRLDYGRSEQTDTNGNVLTTFDAYEDVRGQAVAVSIPALITWKARARGDATRWADAIDLSAGAAHKRTHEHLSPSFASGDASASSTDWGVQARFSLFTLLPANPAAGIEPADWAVFDLGAGVSVLNAFGGRFLFPSESHAVRATRIRRQGFAVRAGLRLPPEVRSGTFATLVAGLDPLIAAGWAADHNVEDLGPGTGQYKLDQSGYEITFANVISWRHGRWRDPAGYIDGSTSGWSAGLPVGPWGGFRYDASRQPQAMNSGLPDLKRSAWTLWVDALRVWHQLHPAAPAAKS